MNAEIFRKEVGRAEDMFIAAINDSLAACDNRPPSMCFPTALSRIESIMAMHLSADTVEGTMTDEQVEVTTEVADKLLPVMLDALIKVDKDLSLGQIIMAINAAKDMLTLKCAEKYYDKRNNQEEAADTVQTTLTPKHNG